MLNDIIHPIKLSEEEYSIYRTSDFFKRILEEENIDIKNSREIADIFLKFDIDGKKLSCMEENKLIAMGITNRDQRLAILINIYNQKQMYG